MFTPQQTVLFVIDVQGKLARLVHNHAQVIRSIQGLIKAAQILDIPIIWTEQAPEKIGKTIPEIADLLTDIEPLAKTTFSSLAEPAVQKKLQSLNRNQIIVAGIETHVCVYQTIAQLIDDEFSVQVVVDAVSSRTLENKQTALNRIHALGADMTSSEMIITELLQTSTHPKFREIIQLIK